MKQIKVTAANSDRINSAIESIEGRATARTVDFGAVLAAIDAAESHPLLAGVPKKQWVGTKADFQFGETFPNAYKWTPYGTCVAIERRASGWFFTGAARCPVPSKDELNLSVHQSLADEYMRRVRGTFRILPDMEAAA